METLLCPLAQHSTRYGLLIKAESGCFRLERVVDLHRDPEPKVSKVLRHLFSPDVGTEFGKRDLTVTRFVQSLRESRTRLAGCARFGTDQLVNVKFFGASTLGEFSPRGSTWKREEILF